MSQKLFVGDKAPAFSGKDQNGKTIKLSDFKGKKIVLYFYPHDNTESCTNQACNLRDSFTSLKNKTVDVIGISTDDIKRHKKFETKYTLPFTLIADTERVIVNKYHVWQWKKFMGREFEGIVRTTFLINEKGIIEHIIDKVKTKTHFQQISTIWGI